MDIKTRALGGFSKKKNETLLGNAHTVLNAMENNPNFPSAPLLLELRQQLAAFEEKMALGRSRSSAMDIATRNGHRKVLERTLKKLAAYVNSEAGNSLQALLSSGFEIKGTAGSPTLPQKVSGIRLSDGKQACQLRLDFDLQPNKMLYEYRYAQERDEHNKHRWSEVVVTGSSKGNIMESLRP